MWCLKNISKILHFKSYNKHLHFIQDVSKFKFSYKKCYGIFIDALVQWLMFYVDIKL